MKRLHPLPIDRIGDAIIAAGTVFGFIGATLRLVIVIALVIGALASIDEHSAPGFIVLAIVFYLWHRSKISRLTKLTNNRPVTPTATR